MITRIEDLPNSKISQYFHLKYDPEFGSKPMEKVAEEDVELEIGNNPEYFDIYKVKASEENPHKIMTLNIHDDDDDYHLSGYLEIYKDCTIYGEGGYGGATLIMFDDKLYSVNLWTPMEKSSSLKHPTDEMLLNTSIYQDYNNKVNEFNF